jgi:hypothetical protein
MTFTVAYVGLAFIIPAVTLGICLLSEKLSA